MGAISGIAIAVVIGMVLFKWSVRINLQQFFQVMGVFLLLIVSGLVISVLGHTELLTKKVRYGYLQQLTQE